MLLELASTIVADTSAPRCHFEAWRLRVMRTAHLYSGIRPRWSGCRLNIWATSVSPVTDCWVFPNTRRANSGTLRVANYIATTVLPLRIRMWWIM